MMRLNFKHRLLIRLFVVAVVLFSSPATLADSTTGGLHADPPELLATAVNTKLSKRAQEAAKLLDIEHQVLRLLDIKSRVEPNTFDREALRLQLATIRKVMTAELELRTTAAKLDKEIAIEQHALDKLTRKRDLAVAMTNNLNFLQLNILSIIIDGPLEESRHKNRILDGNRLNIVSGLTVGGLALLTLLEQRGETRSSIPPPNLLGQALGFDTSSDEKLPPMLWTYLNSVPADSPNGLTRRERLIEYWKTTKVLAININKPTVAKQVSVTDSQHCRRCETIKLIQSRVTMLFDMRAMIDLLDAALVDLLQALD